MNCRRLILLLLALLHFAFCVLPCSAAAVSVTTATLTVTNTAGATNGDYFRIFQGADATGYLYTFTNRSPVGFHYISTTNAAGYSAQTTLTNTYRKLTNDWSTRNLRIRYASSTSLTIDSDGSLALTLTISTNWGTLAIVTNVTGGTGNAQMGSNVLAYAITLLNSTAPKTITDWSTLGGGAGSGFVATNSTEALTLSNRSSYIIGRWFAGSNFSGVGTAPIIGTNAQFITASQPFKISLADGTEVAKVSTSTAQMVGIFAGDALGLTNLSGANINAGTIGTNQMDATAYAAFIGGGSGFDPTQPTNYNGVFTGNGLAITNVPATNVAGLDQSINLERGKVVANALAANSNSLLAIVIGDSLASENPGQCGVTRGVFNVLAHHYGFAGIVGRSMTYDGAVPLNATLEQGSGAVNQSAGTNWWGLWHTGASNSIVRWGTFLSSVGAIADTLQIWWIAHPGGTNFHFQVSTNGGTFATVALCNGLAATPTLRHTNFSVARNSYRVQAYTTNLGANVYVGAGIFNAATNGVVPWFIEKGGANWGQFTNVSLVSWHYAFSNFNPRLIVYQADEVSAIGATALELYLTNQVFPAFLRASNATVVLCGNSYRGDGITTFDADNAILRRLAKTYNFIYYDTQFEARDYFSLTNNGYLADTIHYNQLGSDAFGGSLVRRLGWLDNKLLPANSVIHGTLTVDQVAAGNMYWSTNSANGSISNNNSGGVEVKDDLSGILFKKLSGAQMNLYPTVNPAAYTIANSFLSTVNGALVLNCPGDTAGTFIFEQGGSVRANFNSVGGFVVNSANDGNVTNAVGSVAANAGFYYGVGGKYRGAKELVLAVGTNASQVYPESFTQDYTNVYSAKYNPATGVNKATNWGDLHVTGRITTTANAGTNAIPIALGNVHAFSGAATALYPDYLGWSVHLTAANYMPSYTCFTGTPYKFNVALLPGQTGGYTNVDVIQRWGLTNATSLTLNTRGGFSRADSAFVGAQMIGNEGLAYHFTDVGTNTVWSTNSYSVSPNYTNADFSIELGRFSTSPNTNTVWWLGAYLVFR